MQDSKITVVFKNNVLSDGKIEFEAGKEYQVEKTELGQLALIKNLTPESFWQNIKFMYNFQLVEMNKVQQYDGDLKWPPSNECFECLIYELVAKHVNAAFEYLKAKNREEVKNSYKQWKNWIKDDKLKNSLDVGKNKLKLLYPEKKDYFDGLSKDKLQQEIDDKLLLGTQYDKKLEYGIVLDDKDQAPQVQKIAERLEDELYKELLEVDQRYIDYFSPDFLYRKIIIEKSNDGELNDFQKAFIKMWIPSRRIIKKNPNIVNRMQFGFKDCDPEQWVLRGWELCKFVCQEKIKDCVNEFKSGEKIDNNSVTDFRQGINAVNLFLSCIPKKQISKIIFPNNNNLDDMLEKIINILQNKKFRKYVISFDSYFGTLYRFAKLIINNNDNNNNKGIFFRVITIDSSMIVDLSSDFIFDNLDNEAVWYAFCKEFYYLSVVERCFDKDNKLIPEYKKKFMKMLEACPRLINNCNVDFIFDNLDNEIVWYAFCNGYHGYGKVKLFDYCIDKDKKVVQERKEKLFKLVEARPDLLINVYADRNKCKNYEFLYPLISDLIFKKNRSLLQVFKSMNSEQYEYFWTDYFGWFKKNLETKTKTQIGQRDINTGSNRNWFEIKTSTNQNEQNKNNGEIINIDIEKEKSSISKNNFEKIIKCERFISNKYRIYQENYWNSSENDLVWKLLKKKRIFIGQENIKLFQIEISREKYLQNHQDLNENTRKNVNDVFDYILGIETGNINRNYIDYVYVVKKMEEYDPNYPGFRELKSYLPYLVIIHWSINIAIPILSLAIVVIPWIFLHWGWSLGLSFITVPACCIACLLCLNSLRYQTYYLAEKILWRSKLREYANRRRKYRTVTDLFEQFIDSELYFIGDQAWEKVKQYFSDNALDLENKIKKYSGIKNFNEIDLDDVKTFINRHGNTLMDKINNFFDDALTGKINSMTIGEIANRFRNHVNHIDNNLLVACEKFINKNIAGHLNNIKEMLEIKGRNAYFRHEPNTDEKLIKYDIDISYDLSELLWETLKEEHEKDKNLNLQNDISIINHNLQNQSIIDGDKKPLEEIALSENIINTSSKQ